MKDLYRDIATIIEMYFDKKIKNASIPEELRDEIWDKVVDLIDDMQDMATDLDKDIDNEIEAVTTDCNASYYDELVNDMAFRERELIDISRDNALTR